MSGLCAGCLSRHVGKVFSKELRGPKSIRNNRMGFHIISVGSTETNSPQLLGASAQTAFCDTPMLPKQLGCLISVDTDVIHPAPTILHLSCVMTSTRHSWLILETLAQLTPVSTALKNSLQPLRTIRHSQLKPETGIHTKRSLNTTGNDVTTERVLPELLKYFHSRNWT